MRASIRTDCDRLERRGRESLASGLHPGREVDAVDGAHARDYVLSANRLRLAVDHGCPERVELLKRPAAGSMAAS